ncbi:hypothetical protein ANN_05221 [Periplaneta americana]|uniref:Tc1-like transposase DDE domain-containing protein n=1 Tax=Periplaneta americana TaxID=6978 RepID=A0ABQ8TAI8_PERAM|nr:hypothetical protein ANN_05221 [Periplaneta americana]
MSPGSSTESYPAFAHVGLRENPGKNLNQITCPDRESNPGHLVLRPDALTIHNINLRGWTPTFAREVAFFLRAQLLRSRLDDDVGEKRSLLMSKQRSTNGFEPIRWFTRKRDVDPVDWPPNSPDMNSIKNLWAAVKRILRSNWAEQPPFRTPEELWDRVLDAWEEVAKNLDLFHNLVDSMPRRMRAFVDAGGLWTRY